MQKNRKHPHTPRKTALMVIHGTFAWPGALAEILPRLGYGIQICHTSAGHTLPATLDTVDAVFLMGGPMGVYDAPNHPWLQEEIAWVKKHTNTGTPFIGICLGCQILAHVHGGQVTKGEHGLCVGLSPLRSISNAAFFHSTLLEQVQVFNWQQDTYTLPQNAVRLAENGIYTEQAALFGRQTMGLQFHPEVTPEIIKHLYDRDLHHLTEENCPQHVASQASVLKELSRHAPQVHRWLETMLRDFLQTPPIE